MTESDTLYHFLPTKWALKAIRDRRLKATDPDNTNDLFEFFTRQWQTVDDRENAQWVRWREAQVDDLSTRILCFSKTYTNPLLWGHYAKKGTGICLSFDVNGGAFPVCYKPHRIAPSEQIFREEFAIQVRWKEHAFVKAKYWEHEEEWRMLAQVDSLYLCPMTGLVYFPFQGRMTLREILIGPRCKDYNSNIRYQLEKLITDYDPKPNIVSMRLSSSDFRIEGSVADECEMTR